MNENLHVLIHPRSHRVFTIVGLTATVVCYTVGLSSGFANPNFFVWVGMSTGAITLITWVTWQVRAQGEQRREQ